MIKTKVLLFILFFILTSLFAINTNEKNIYNNKYYKDNNIRNGMHMFNSINEYFSDIKNNIFETYSLDESDKEYNEFISLGKTSTVFFFVGISLTIAGVALVLVSQFVFLKLASTTTSAAVTSMILYVISLIGGAFMIGIGVILGIFIGLPLMLVGFLVARSIKKNISMEFKPEKDELTRCSFVLKF